MLLIFKQISFYYIELTLNTLMKRMAKVTLISMLNMM